MSASEWFDEIYDAEIERIVNALPKVDEYPMPTIVYPVDLRELNFGKQLLNPEEFTTERQDERVEHTIEFVKVMDNGKSYWAWSKCLPHK